MGETTRKSAAEHALGIIARIVRDRPKIPEREPTSELSGSGDVVNKTNLASHFREGAR